MTKLITILAAILFSAASLTAQAGVVEFRDDQLLIDGQPQPQLYGAEVQYFRPRGGQERNVPRQVVIDLWTKALDKVLEAKMNTISFYLPWDFHEYKEGHFDFTGTADDDGDGRPDFPSRDVKTFIKMALDRGIKNIMARPGPYINAEWGFLGFGAIPLWFHDKYPHSHAHDPQGRRSMIYSYWSPELMAHTKTWLTTVHREVLASHIGPGKPIHFIQIDNETNYMWSSLYRHDFSPLSIAKYREFLKERYTTLDNLNLAHRRSWKSWDEIRPPLAPRLNIAEDQDWYRYEDKTIHVYLSRIRAIWDEIGVREPTVLFTLAESYNAPGDGLLPRYEYRNDPGKTGMMTVNLYPKTYQPGNNALHNSPFKADHDVKAADTATDHYIRQKQEWVLGPEIQGGWWRGVPVSLDSRQQTYLTTIGHGLKAMFVYYFHEGDNWQYTWVKDQIEPYYNELRKEDRFRDIPERALPNEFWDELNKRFAENVLSGWDVRHMWNQGGTQPRDLYFDAALGTRAEERAPFKLLKKVGEKIMAPYGAFLGQAVALTDPVCLVKDSATHAPSPIAGLESTRVRSDWEGALLAYLLHAGIDPRILHWGLTPESEYAARRLLVYQDNGLADSRFASFAKAHVERGGGLLNFLHDGLTEAVVGNNADCQSMSSSISGFEGRRCTLGTGLVYQIRAPIYTEYNTDTYAEIGDVPERQKVLEEIVREMKIEPAIKIPGADRVVAFGRTDRARQRLWVTVKTGRTDGYTGKVKWSGASDATTYSVVDVLSGRRQTLTGTELKSQGFVTELDAHGSTAYFVEPAQ